MIKRRADKVIVQAKTGKSADMIPNELITKQCAGDTHLEMLMKDIKAFISEKSSVPQIVKAVASLQLVTGLRISEVLQIKGSDIDEDGHIYIRGLKGSANRIVQPIFYTDYWLAKRNDLTPIGSTYSRYFFYRWYKKGGLYYLLPDADRARVTHLFRHILADKLRSLTGDAETVSGFVGHKSVKSTESYGIKKKAKRKSAKRPG